MDDKTCSKCKVSKAHEAFPPDKRARDGLSSWCKDCRHAYQKTWYAKAENRQRVIDKSNDWQKARRPYRKTYHRDWRFGLAEGEWESLFEAQGRCCAICKRTDPGVARVDWTTDHDHSCCPKGQIKRCGNCVRGILCHFCNTAIGSLQDSPEALRAAADYIERARRA